jgi:argonaute-like protein implicated in RNA metabolism and viral defense
MFNYHDSIEEIEKKIKKYSERRNKVENANYILAMQLKAIKNGELKTVEDIAKWDFEMIKTGDLVMSINENSLEKSKIIK